MATDFTVISTPTEESEKAPFKIISEGEEPEAPEVIQSKPTKYNNMRDGLIEALSVSPSGITEAVKDPVTQRGAGSLIGSVAGGVVGLSLGPGGALGGSVLGGMAGNQLAGVMQMLSGVDVDASEVLKETTVGGLVDVGLGKFADAITGGYLSRGVAQLFSVDRDVRKTVERGKGVGLDFSTSDVTRMGAAYKTVIGVFPIISNPFVKHATKLRKTAYDNLTGELDVLAPTTMWHEAGADLASSARLNYEKFGKVSEDLYKSFYRKAASASAQDIVPTSSIRGAGKRYKAVVPVWKAGGKEKVTGVSGNRTFHEWITDLKELPDRIPVDQIQTLKEDIKRFGKSILTENEAKALSEVASAIDGGMMKLDLRHLPKAEANELRTAYKAANDFFAENIVTFNNSVADKFKNAYNGIFGSKFKFSKGDLDDTEMVDAILNTKRTDSLSHLRDLVGDKGMREVATRWYGKALDKNVAFDPDLKAYSFSPKGMIADLQIDSKPTYIREILKGTGANPDMIIDTLKSMEIFGDIVLPAKMVQRRFILGGLESAKRGLTFGQRVGAGAVGTVGTLGGVVVPAMMAYYGSKLFASPKVLQSLATLSKKEAKGEGTKLAVMQALNTLQEFTRDSEEGREVINE